MMRGGTKLFKIFGIDVKIHASWWFIFILIAWSLASAYFPQYFPDQTVKTYWFMGIVAAILLFVSVLLHELSHSLVAKAKKIQVESITLFFFGGVAAITKEDMRPSSEFVMAIAGPLFSLLLSGVFYLVYILNGNGIITAISFYLFQLNLILAIFNLVPGFPLDGGRAFRAILYAYYKDLRKATKIAAAGGKVVAGVLIILGIFGIFTGQGGGLWFILLGAFLYFIAGISYEQVVVKEVLGKIPLARILRKSPAAVNAEMKLGDFIKKYVNRETDTFLVLGKNYSGILDLKRVNRLSPKMQGIVKLKQIALPFHQLKILQKKDNAYTAFKHLTSQGIDLLPVMEGRKLIGLVSKQAVMHHLFWSLNYGFGRQEHSLAKRVKKGRWRNDR